MPFVFNDTMGLENEDEDGVRTADIIQALKGHLSEGHRVSLNLNHFKDYPRNTEDY